MDGIRSPLAQVEFFKRGQDIKLTEDFHLREFECKCGNCPFTLMSVDHVYRLQALRKTLRTPIHILSGYRCIKHNTNVGGEKNSLHMYGLATDIHVNGLEPSVVASHCKEFEGLGIYDRWVHVDSRGYHAFWDKRTVGKRK